MSSIFWFAFHAVTPMLLLMLLGWGLQAKGVFDENMLHKMNGFTFRFGLSAMMFCNTYGLTSLADFRLNVMACVLFAALVLTGIGWAEGRLFTRQRNRRGIMMQNAFRSNFAIIGTTLAISVGGVAGGAAAASIQAPAIIYFNVASVVCLSIYSDRPGQTACLGQILKGIITNPMIFGQLAGVLCLAVREFIPRDVQGELVFSLAKDFPFLYEPVESLADMASPLILILLGARINFSAVGNMKKELAVGVIQRLVLAPVVGFGVAFLAQWLGIVDVTPALASALVGLYGSPVAAASAIMAEEMGGDGELARQYVVWTSAFSMVSLFMWLVLLRSLQVL